MFHVRIASESRTRLSFLELSILARREKGAQDCDAQISSAHPDAGGGRIRLCIFFVRPV